jgi:hypothetical protein
MPIILGLFESIDVGWVVEVWAGEDHAFAVDCTAQKHRILLTTIQRQVQVRQNKSAIPRWDLKITEHLESSKRSPKVVARVRDRFDRQVELMPKL